jgi:hypothetical protein
MSSLIEEPPVETIDSTFRYLPSSLTTADTWRANSLVGTRIRPCCQSLSIQVTLNTVPGCVDKFQNGNNKGTSFTSTVFGSSDDASAYGKLEEMRPGVPLSARGIHSSWTGEGFSNPFSTIPIMSSFFLMKSSNSLPLVFVTSLKVRKRN